VGGFHQIYKYTASYNEPFGYLIVFKRCDEDVLLSPDGTALGTPFVQYNGKTIYLLVIDLFPAPTPASRRGQLQPIASLTKDDLVKEL
jgi:hypothetical protein